MSSPSSSSSSSAVNHDVFISFSGEDIRDDFISHLREALGRRKIVAFVDDRDERGDEISPAIVYAIEGSKLSLIVFSETYAFSRSRLDEVVKILECRNTRRLLVVPVFYRVDPSDVRKQTGSFGNAFAEHEKEMLQIDRLKRWKDALTVTADFSGWDSSVVRPDSLLVEEITRDVLKKLNFLSLQANANASATIFKSFVGVDSRVKKVVSLLKNSRPDCLMVGIWGMGGIGKTTVAEAVYNKISHDFEGSYFFRNVREAEEKGELHSLRGEFLSKLLGDDHLHIGASGFQLDFSKFRLPFKRVLIVLDDVDKLSQLEILLGELDAFSAGSRVIVTTRDKEVLESFSITKAIYCVEKLNNKESLQLFCHYAFPRGHLTKSYDGLATKVVDYAQGVPLALKVLGSSLNGKEKHLWESALKKLKRIPNLKILDVLKVSYDSLDDEETKEIFLDIACFFKGKDISYAASMLDNCYQSVFSGIGVLVDKSLITIQGNTLGMHDLLQEIGWDIVHQESKAEPGRRSRLWMPEDVHHVLKRNTGSETVRGMFGNLSKMKAVKVRPDVFENMYNLKFLSFDGSFEISHKVDPSHGLRSFPNEMRYLCWHGYPLKSLPLAFCLENLVELDMSFSNLNQLWVGTQNLRSLKILNLNESKNLRELPDLSRATNVQHMKLYGCESLVSLPSSLKHLQKLTELTLRDCKKLKNLPSNTKLRSLVSLDLHGCSQIDEFPDISTSLQQISLAGTAIEEVPSSIQDLLGLVNLRLGGCKRLKKLPDTFQSLNALETLDLRGCRNVTKLPELPDKIMSLYLARVGIKELPCSIGSHSLLDDLILRSCGSLKTLPKDIWKLESLESLSLSGCSKLEEIPEVQQSNNCLYNIDFSGTAIRELPSSIQRCVSLETLSLNNCQNLSTLPSTLWNLENLRRVTAHATAIKHIPAFVMGMTKLEDLDISGCDSRDPVPLSLPSFTRVSSLINLRLKDLHIVQIPEDIGCLTSLKTLDLSGNDFKILPASLKHLSKLENFDLSYCRRLESLPELPHSLQNLDAHDCASLGTMSSNTGFLAVGAKGMYIFSNCFRLHGHLYNTILTKAKLLFQHKADESILGRRDVMICLPGSNLPDWFTSWSIGPSMTFLLPKNWHNGEFTGFVLCISVSFTDYFRDTNFLILCEYRFESQEGDCLERRTFFRPWQGFGIENRRVRASGSWAPLKVQHRYLGSDHIFLLYDPEMYDGVSRGVSNWFYEAVTCNFHIIDGACEPLGCCRVEKCGFYLSPALSVTDFSKLSLEPTP